MRVFDSQQTDFLVHGAVYQSTLPSHSTPFNPTSKATLPLQVSYVFIQHSNLYIMAVARNNVNAAALLTFLHRLKDVLEFYFGVLEEESLRDNFVIVYELLDEVMDFGYP